MALVNRTKSFDIAFRFLTETHLNVYLTGKAGTGKTTFLKYLIEHSHKNIVVAAPTGVAAINAGGITLHSLFQLPFAPFIPGRTPHENTLTGHPLLSQIKFNSKKRKILINMEVLVIDEVSMVAANTLDAIDIILKSIRKNYNLPFGGVQVLFIGDLHQLPPVVKKISYNEFKEFYKSFYFFDSLVLTQYPPVMVELKKVYRQNDEVFVDILNGIRENKLKPNHLQLLNERLQPNFHPSNEDGYITLTTHNVQADETNSKNLAKLEDRSYYYSAEITGDFPENMYPADSELELKLGSQVMFLKNDGEEKRYFNGKIGVIVELSEDEILVQCRDGEGVIQVNKEVWDNVNYKVDPVTREIEEEKLGSFKQYPLRLAWAITIHKSQGLTFDRLIVDAQKAFTNGQVYVALSRVRSLEGLVLTSPISKQFLGASYNLKEWESIHNNEDVLPKKLEESRVACIRQELLQVFDWNVPVNEVMQLKTTVADLKEKLSPDCQGWISSLSEKFLALNKVAKSFQSSIFKITSHPDFSVDQVELQNRLKDAATYFLPQLEESKEELRFHNLVVTTRKAAETLDGALETLSIFFHDIIHQLKYFSEGKFELTIYLERGKVNKQKITEFKSTYESSSKPKSLVSASEIDHLELYQKIAIYRKEKAKESSTPIYRIFSNNAIKEVCKHLPKNNDQLLLISGFGEAKVAQFGKDVIDLVVDYCDENKVPAKDLFS